MASEMIVRINGVVQEAMLTTSSSTSESFLLSLTDAFNSFISSKGYLTSLEPEEVEEASGWVSNFLGDHVITPTKELVQSKFMDYVVLPFFNWLKDTALHIYDLLVYYSVDIITLGIVGCAVGVMLAPFTGKTPGLWIGRGLLLAMLGSVWRIFT